VYCARYTRIIHSKQCCNLYLKAIAETFITVDYVRETTCCIKFGANPFREIRRGKKEERQIETGQKYNGLPYYIGRP